MDGWMDGCGRVASCGELGWHSGRWQEKVAGEGGVYLLD